MTKPPMTDFEKQRLIDMDREMRKLAETDENVHILSLGDFKQDPFTYTKELLTAICQATGKPVPSDQEILKIVSRARKDIDKTI